MLQEMMIKLQGDFAVITSTGLQLLVVRMCCYNVGRI